MLRLSLCSMLILTGSLIVGSCDSQVELKPPKAKIEAKVDTLFGREMVDNYFWLRERDNPVVMDFLKSENAHT